MSKFNIEDINYLYESISNQSESSLDTQSEFYDQELAETVEDIFASISINMISSGHTAEGVISFLNNSSEQDILEYYLNPPVIAEGTVSEEQIEAELARLDEGLGAVISGLKVLGKGLKPAARLASVATKRAAGPGVRKAVGGAVSKVGGAVSKVKDIASRVAPKLPGIAKGALMLGTGVGAGYLGAKLTSAGSKKEGGSKVIDAAGGKGGKVTVGREYDAVLGGKKGKVTYSDSGQKFFRQTEKDAPKPATQKPTASTSSAPAATGTTKPQASTKPSSKTYDVGGTQLSKDAINKKYDELKKTDPKAATEFGRKANQAIFQYKPPSGKSQMERDAQELRDMTTASQRRQKGENITGADVAAERKKSEAAANTTNPSNTSNTKKDDTKNTKKESYDAFDIVLEYLLETEQAETLSEATYIMMEMDSDAIQSIVLEKKNFFLDEFDSILNGLIEEGYDLSEFHEEEILESFISEGILDAFARTVFAIHKARKAAGAVKAATKAVKATKAVNAAAPVVKSTRKAAGAVKATTSALTKGGSGAPIGGISKLGSKGGAIVKSPGGKMVDATIKPVKVGVIKPPALPAASWTPAAPAAGKGGKFADLSKVATLGAGKGAKGSSALVATGAGKGAKGALVTGTTATGVGKAAKGALAAAGKGGRGGKAALVGAGLLGAGALAASMLGGKSKKQAPRRQEGLVGSATADKPLKANAENMKVAADLNKQGGIALGQGGSGYLAKKGDKFVIKQGKAIGADDGIIGKAARALGLTKGKDKALEAQRQAKARKNREAYLAGQELTDTNITDYQVKGAKRKGQETGKKVQ